MSKAKTHEDMIRKMVKADNDGIVPERLILTIKNFAKALEMRDTYADEIMQRGVIIVEPGSQGQMVTKQNPVCTLLQNQEQLCMSYAKMLGLTSAKAAAKPEDNGGKTAASKMDEFIDGIKG